MESDITGDIVFGVDTFLQTPDEPHYTYRVEWSLEDDEWVCRVAEFPSLSARAADPVRALQGVRELVGAVVGEMLDNGERPPEPFVERDKRRDRRHRAPKRPGRRRNRPDRRGIWRTSHTKHGVNP